MKRLKSFRESLLEDLKDPIHAAAYMNAAINEGDFDFLLVALGDVAEALGQSAKLNALLKAKKKPDTAAIDAFLKKIGLHLTVIPQEKSSYRRAA